MTATAEVNFYDNYTETDNFLSEVLTGLGQTQPALSPKYFYDETGSRLFDQICHLPEYYPTRTEAKILTDHADDIAQIIGHGCQLIEPGSGSSQKVRLLLDSLRPDTYVPMDISGDYIVEVSEQLAQEYPWLNIHAACIDFTRPLDLSFCTAETHKVAFFPGSSIGNFEPEQAQVFLTHLAESVGKGGGLLIGVDLKKDENILSAAYNDRAGVTGEFNKNVLHRLNNEFNSNFDLDQFEHKAIYNSDKGRIEMHLVSLCEQSVTIDNNKFDFHEGQTIHTESSYKYTIEEFQNLASKAGFIAIDVWVDSEQLFSVHYFEVC